jgi:hypothetical protein
MKKIIIFVWFIFVSNITHLFTKTSLNKKNKEPNYLSLEISKEKNLHHDNEKRLNKNNNNNKKFIWNRMKNYLSWTTWSVVFLAIGYCIGKMSSRNNGVWLWVEHQ